MTTRKTGAICLLLIALFLPLALSAISEAGVIFLLIQPGSRAGGMGGAYIAMVDDAYAPFWNPGAMAFNRKTQFAVNATNWFGDTEGINDMYHMYLAWNQYFDYIGNIGFDVVYMTYGSQQRTGEGGEDEGTFHSYEIAVGPSYAYELYDQLGLGASVKFIYSDLAPEGQGESEVSQKGQGTSWAFDIGIKHTLRTYGVGERPWKSFWWYLSKLDYAWVLQNIGPDITYINESQADPLPMNWCFGLSYRLLESKINKLTLNAEWNKLLANDDGVFERMFTAWSDDDQDQEIDEIIRKYGVEYIYYDILALRAGYYQDIAGSMTGPSFGIGLGFEWNKRYKINADFAMEQGGELQDYQKTFSLRFEF